MKIEDFTISAHDFEKSMREIDAQLKLESASITGREIHGISAFCERFQIDSLDFNHPVARRVVKWFMETYGSRLHMQNVIGTTAVSIKGDLFLLPCYLIYGSAHIICSWQKMGSDLGPKTRTDGTLPTVNVLEHVQGLTKQLASRLSYDESNTILSHYIAARDLFQHWSTGQGKPHMLEAASDFNIAVDCLVKRPNYGMAKWSYLQATEKVFKSYLAMKVGTFKRVHSLSSLARAAQDAGLPIQPQEHLDAIQCDAGMRYDSSTVTKDQAYQAHLHAMDVISNVLFDLNPNHWTMQSALRSDL